MIHDNLELMTKLNPLPTPPMTDDMSRLLQRVARSFALSVKVLPSELRVPVALGYLLARASDTIAGAGEALMSFSLVGLAVMAWPWRGLRDSHSPD